MLQIPTEQTKMKIKKIIKKNNKWINKNKKKNKTSFWSTKSFDNGETQLGREQIANHFYYSGQVVNDGGGTVRGGWVPIMFYVWVVWDGVGVRGGVEMIIIS